MKSAILCVGFLAVISIRNALSKSDCRDVYDKATCIGFKQKGYCEDRFRQKSMKKNCGLTCRFCGPDVTPPPPLPGQDNCGISTVQQGRVIAGSNARMAAWPWQVAIYYRGYFHCGGSLITPQYLITASHCLRGKNMTRMRVVLGLNNQAAPDAREQRFRVAGMTRHPSFEFPSRLDNDIAILKLDYPAMIDDRVKTVCLPKVDERVQVGTKCFVTGWGTTSSGDISNPLQQAALRITDQKICHALNYPSLKIDLTDNMVCAGNGPKDPASACHGDSGGPLVCQNDNGRWTLHGVVSWGSKKCNTKDAYSVFARVSNYYSWIRKTVLS